MTREEREKAIAFLKDMQECTYDGLEEIRNAIEALEQQTTSFEWCTDCKEYDQEKHCCHRWSKVIRNTVEEMKRETCEDAISRADVEQTVEDNILCYTHSDRPIDQDPDTECHMAIRTALRMLRKDLRKLPPVTPRSKIGHWEHGKELSKEYRGRILVDVTYADWHCSNCNYVIEGTVKPKWNYCPNCGAKMIEPQESEG